MKYKSILIVSFIILLLPLPIFLLVILTSGKQDHKVVFKVDQYEYAVFETMGGELIEQPDDPTKTGYTFGGWYLDEEYDKKFEADIYLRKELTTDIVVYAKFVINQYTITFNTNGGTSIGSITDDYKTPINKPSNPTKLGHDFLGWYTDNGTYNEEFDLSTIQATDIVLYARWSVSIYNINYHLDGGTNGNNPLTYNFKTEDIELNDPTKVGHTFKGWYTEPTFDNKITIIDTAKLADQNLYAKFSANNYTIVFETNGGSNVPSITKAYGSEIIQPEDPKKSGYIFRGWYTDNGTLLRKYTFTTMPLNGITLYAKWKVMEEDDSLDIVQTSNNYIGDTLKNVTIKCNSHSTCSVQWEDETEIIKSAFEYHNVIHTAKNGEVVWCKASVSAIAKLDANYCVNGMLFTLNKTKSTASVRVNTDTLVRAVIPAKVEHNGTVYTVTAIDNKGFYNIDTLEYVYVPPTITQYLSTTFAHNDNLKTVDLDKDLKVLGTQMFMYCSNLSNVTIPEGVATIPSGFLDYCYDIEQINIPAGVTEILSSAFARTAITSISLPMGLLNIGEYAFAQTGLTEIVIPKSVTSIGESAFSNVSSLEKIEILSEEISIDDQAFKMCTKLRNVYLNASNLVNSINSDTTDTSYVLAYLKNQDIIYVNNTINVSSNYIKSMFTRVTSNKAGYNAYELGKYSNMSLLNFNNRVYTKNSSLFGNEQIKIKNPNNEWETVNLTQSMIQNFDTSTTGKKVAKITYKYNEVICSYYVLPSINSTSLNCISQVNNFYPTYYVGETLNLANVTLTYMFNDNGYMKSTNVPATQSMIEGFNTNLEGIRFTTFKHDGLSYELRYYVKANPTETITNSSFDKGLYYNQDSTEETEHFIINIKKGSYISKNYKEVIEKIYLIEQEVSGLQFASKITLDVNETNYPSCAGTTLNITPSDLLFASGTAFVHELAHALDHSQTNKTLYSSTLTEGFATYIEILTATCLYKYDPITYAYYATIYDTVRSNNSLASKIFLYDFENYILHLGRDELAANSQYEAGCKLFAYLDYKYGDFCSWMADANFNPQNLQEWKIAIKEHYNNSNLFKDLYQEYFSAGDKYGNYIGTKYNTNLHNTLDLTALHKYNYYFNFFRSKNYQGNISFIYKDLYINIDSARDQLNKMDIDYQNFYLQASKDVEIELYNANGTLINTITNSSTKFSLENVSFIKLVGTNNVSLTLSYE